MDKMPRKWTKCQSIDKMPVYTVGIRFAGIFGLSSIKHSSVSFFFFSSWVFAFLSSSFNKFAWNFSTAFLLKQPFLGILNLRNFGINLLSSHVCKNSILVRVRINFDFNFKYEYQLVSMPCLFSSNFNNFNGNIFKYKY